MEAFALDFRARNVGGPVMPPRLLRRDGTVVPPGGEGAALGGGAEGPPPLTLLIHGFANDRAEGSAKLWAFSNAVEAVRPDLGDRRLMVLWPGDDLLSPLSYSVEEDDARDTAAKLADFLLGLRERTGRPNLVAHSLGCLVALETMRRLRAAGIAAGEVVLMAGAVDCDALARGTRYREAVQAAGQVAVVSSKRDRVLQWAFPVGDFLAGLFTGGYTRTALGRTGAAPWKGDPVPAPVVDVRLLKDWDVGHGDYLAEADGAMGPKHLSSARLVAGCLGGSPPVYPPPVYPPPVHPPPAAPPPGG